MNGFIESNTNTTIASACPKGCFFCRDTSSCEVCLTEYDKQSNGSCTKTVEESDSITFNKKGFFIVVTAISVVVFILLMICLVCLLKKKQREAEERN